MCTYRDLLPCDRVPVSECLNGACDLCVKYMENIEPIVELVKNIEGNEEIPSKQLEEKKQELLII